RFERSGVLPGLPRVRGMTQDDSHIFCTPEQIVPELKSLLEFVLRLLRTFGFDDFEAEISTRPAAKSVGSDDDWQLATAALFETIESSGLAYEVADGEGAFYGPKIDVHVRDAIGRRWQLSTLPVDFQMGKRFGITYSGDDDAAGGTVGVNARDRDVERGVAVDEFVERLRADVLARA